MEDSVIKFYKVNDPYGTFSNFYPSPIVLISEIWSTVEDFFQASKFYDLIVVDKIKALKSPMDAAREGRNRNYTIRPDWEEVKDTIMYKAVKAKFLQHPNMNLFY